MAKQNKAERQARLREPVAPEVATALTRDQLYAQAKERGIKGASKFTRDQLIEALREPEAPLTPADRPVVNTPDISTVEGRRALANDRIAAAAEHYQEVMADPNAPKPEEDLAKRTIKAKAEQKALKAWQFGGMQGDRPVTPNYDAVCAVYVGVAKPPKTERARAPRTTGDGATRRQRTAPTARGTEARQARKAKGKRGMGRKVNDAELDAYVAEVRAAHPDAAMYDELLYAHWITGLAVSPEKFDAAWQRSDGGDQDLDTEEGTDLPPDDDASESPAAVKAALEHALRPKADKPKRTTKKAPAKATPSAPKKAGAKKEVTPIPKSTPRKRTRAGK